MRILRKIPGWLWWLAGLLVVALYACFFYYFFVSPFGFRWKALYGDASYPDEYEIHGIDISHYQGNIDWDKLRNHGFIGNHPVRFIMIKATEGSTKLDDKFVDNFYQAREYGFIRGAYHFWSNKTTGVEQANHYINSVKLEEGDLPPVLDVEHKAKNLSDEEIVNLNLPTGVPYVFEFNNGRILQKDYFLGDPEEIKRKMAAVAAQGKTT